MVSGTSDPSWLEALPGRCACSLPNPLPAALGAGAVGRRLRRGRGCNRLEAFAEAGIAYADKAPALMDQSFEAAVAVDSGALLEERSRLSEPQRREALKKLDEVMEERCAGYAAASEPARLDWDAGGTPAGVGQGRAEWPPCLYDTLVSAVPMDATTEPVRRNMVDGLRKDQFAGVHGHLLQVESRWKRVLQTPGTVQVDDNRK